MSAPTPPAKPEIDYRVLCQVGIAVFFLVLGCFFAAIWHSAGPLLAGFIVALIMVIFACLDKNHPQASLVLTAVLVTGIVAAEVYNHNHAKKDDVADWTRPTPQILE